MWKYLIINGLWFTLIFFVHFFGSKKDRGIILFSIFVSAVLLAMRGYINPIAWFYYLVFSLGTYYGAFLFHHWSFAELIQLKNDIRISGEKLVHEKNLLALKTQRTDTLEKKADEIVEFYEQTKEMSKSLDALETFLIFSEALSEYFEFETVKLSIFDSEQTKSEHPEEVYELKGADFKGVFDRSAYLKDKKKVMGEVFPFDEQVYHRLIQTREPIRLEDDKKDFFEGDDFVNESFTAYPIFVNDKMFAIVTMMGIQSKGDPLLHILIDRFVAEIQRVKLYEGVETLAITDGLTGVYVRKHLMERLEGEVDRSKRFGLKLSLLMIDVDHFKRFNDEFGHLVGDVVLRQVAQTIMKNVREVDFVGRYGGEEFSVGLIETDEHTASQVAERIRRSIEKKDYRAYGEHLKVTVSIGYCTYSAKLNSVGLMIEEADAALYQAKRLGRNRICAAS